MRHRQLLILFFIASSAILASCRNKNYCVPGEVRVFLVGFDSNEVRSLRVLKYAKGDMSHRLDSAEYHYNDRPYFFSQFGDTINIDRDLVGPEADYVLTALPVNRTWTVKDISYSEGYKHYPEDETWQCPISEFYVDGQKRTDVLDEGEIMYLYR